MNQKSYKRSVVAVLALAALVRTAAALYINTLPMGQSGAQDEVSYSMLGQRLASGFGLTFPTAWYPWIDANAPQSYYSAAMSMYLGAVYWLFGYQPLVARLLTACLSTGVVLCIVLLARRLFAERVAIVSGVIATLYAYLVFYGVTLVTETPFLLALLVAILLAYRIADGTRGAWIWIALGISLAVATLFRMAVVFFVPVLLLWIAARQREWRMIWIPATIIVLAVLPFTVRNYQLWHRFLLLESQFGHVFWNGNHPDHGDSFHGYRVFPIPPDVLASKNDAQITSTLLQMGVENVVNDPVHFVRLTASRIYGFLTFWPTAESTFLANAMRVVSFGIMLPFFLLGLALSRQRWRELLPIWLFLFVHFSVYAISWTQIRYRIPMDAVLIPFAGFAVTVLATRLHMSSLLWHGVKLGRTE